jgi:flagellar hook-associated protein 3 FlgL
MSSNSFSRLGSANTYDNAQRTLMTRQSTLAAQQENLTAGKRVLHASDDPTSAAQAERALNRISRIATDQRALDAQRNSITVAETTLGDVNDALQSFRELVVSAGNGSFSNADRKTVALQLTGLRDQIVSLANRKDTNGLPLFGALGSALAPFVGPASAAPDYTFNGLPGQSASAEVSIPFSLDGDSAFMMNTARDGAYNVTLSPATSTLQTSGVTVTNPQVISRSAYAISITATGPGTLPGTTTTTYNIVETPTAPDLPDPTYPLAVTATDYPTGALSVTGINGMALSLSGTPAVGDTVSVKPSPSIFSVLDDAIRDIGNASSSSFASQAVSQALKNLDIGMGRVSAVRGQAGELLNRADRINDSQGKRAIQMEADRSRAEDIDMVKGISDFQNQQTGYQAALQSYAQIQKLSLFNYIG